jgi:hypothetical protein
MQCPTDLGLCITQPDLFFPCRCKKVSISKTNVWLREETGKGGAGGGAAAVDEDDDA